MVETELERLVVRLVGDSGDYSGVLESAIRDAGGFAATIEEKMRESIQQSKMLEDTAGRMGAVSATALAEYSAGLIAVEAALDEGLISALEYAQGSEKLDASLQAIALAEIAASKAIEKENQELARAKQIIESVVTAEDRHADTVDELNAMLGKGQISQYTYNKALEQSLATLPEVQDAQKAANQALQESASITSSVTTIEERYAKTVDELKAHLDSGRISLETYNRALEQHNPQLIQAKQVTDSVVSAEERHSQTVDDLRGMLDSGRISQETYNRALERSLATLPEVQAAQQAENAAVQRAQQIVDSAHTAQDQYRQKIEDLSIALEKGKIDQSEFNAAVDRLSFDKSMTGLNQIAQGMTSLGIRMTAVGAAISAPLIMIGNQAINASSNLGESINAVNVTFGEASNIVQQYAADADQAMGLSQRAFNEAATTTGSLLQNLAGLSAEDSANEFNKLAQRASDMASVFNTDVSDAMAAVSSALRGETEPIRRYGVSLDQVAIKAKALEMGIAGAGQELTREQKTLAALQIVYEQTERTAGDFANTSGELANASRVQQAAYENLIATIGDDLIPIKMKLLQVTTSVMGIFASLSPETQSLVTLFGVLAAGVGITIGALGASLVVVGQMITAYTTIAIALKGAEVAQRLFNYAAMASPYIIGFAALAGLAAIIYKINQASEATRNHTKAMEEMAAKTASSIDESNEAFRKMAAEAGSLTSESKVSFLSEMVESTAADRKKIEQELELAKQAVDAAEEDYNNRTNQLGKYFYDASAAGRAIGDQGLEAADQGLNNAEASLSAATSRMQQARDMLYESLDEAGKQNLLLDELDEFSIKVATAVAESNKLKDAISKGMDENAPAFDTIIKQAQRFADAQGPVIAAFNEETAAIVRTSVALDGANKQSFLEDQTTKATSLVDEVNNQIEETKVKIEELNQGWGGFWARFAGSAELEKQAIEMGRLQKLSVAYQSRLEDISKAEKAKKEDVVVVNEESQKLIDVLQQQLELIGKSADEMEQLKLASKLDEAKASPEDRQKSVELLDQIQAAEATQSIKDLTKGFDEQRESIGKNKEEMEQLKLAMQLDEIGATNEERGKAIDSLDKLQAAQAEEKLAETIKTTNDSLIDQFMQLAKGADEYKLWKLQMEGLSETQLDVVRGGMELVKWQEEHNKSMEKGKHVIEQYMLPTEKLQKQIEELANLKDVGAIDDKTYERAIAGVEKDLKEIQDKAEIDLKFNYQGLEAGTFEDIAQIEEQIASIRNREVNPEVRDEADKAKKMRDEIVDKREAVSGASEADTGFADFVPAAIGLGLPSLETSPIPVELTSEADTGFADFVPAAIGLGLPSLETSPIPVELTSGDVRDANAKEAEEAPKQTDLLKQLVRNTDPKNTKPLQGVTL